MSSYFSFERFINGAPQIIQYFPVTLHITLVSLIAATIIGVLVAAVRVQKVRVLETVCKAYLILMRGVPFVVLMLMLYYYIPYLAFVLFGKDMNSWDKIILVETAFIIHEGAYIGEIMRGAIESVPKVQSEAAYSIGLSTVQTFTRIILPQSVKVAIPSYGAELVDLFQSTAITYMIGVTDFIGRAGTVATYSGHYIEAYVFVAIIYVVVSALIELIFRILSSQTHYGIKNKTALAKGD